jgi:TPR repeat protein
MYMSGTGVKKDFVTAGNLFEAACMHKEANMGCSYYAGMYERGEGQLKDIEMAYKYYVLGCDKGQKEDCTKSEEIKKTLPKADGPADTVDSTAVDKNDAPSDGIEDGSDENSDMVDPMANGEMKPDMKVDMKNDRKPDRKPMKGTGMGILIMVN